MKKLLIFVLLGLFLASCTPQNQNKTSVPIAELIENNQFTFMARRANPSSYEVTKYINKSVLDNLSFGYTIVIKENEISVDLPYFGEMRSATFGRDRSGIKFVSKDYSINKNKNKKGNWMYRIIPKDQNNIQEINIEIFKNGNTSVYVNANDRQSISYDGYIMQNEPEK